MADYTYSYCFVNGATEFCWDPYANNAGSEAYTTPQPATNTEVNETAAFEYEYPDPAYCSESYPTDPLFENERAVLARARVLRTLTREFLNSTPADPAQAARNNQGMNHSLNTTAFAANALAANTLSATASATPDDPNARQFSFRGVSSVPLTAPRRSNHRYCCVNGYRWACYVPGCTKSFKCGREVTRHFRGVHQSELATYSPARLVQIRWERA